MSKEEILEKLKRAIIELDDEEANRLLKEGLQAQLSPTEMITEGLMKFEGDIAQILPQKYLKRKEGGEGCVGGFRSS